MPRIKLTLAYDGTDFCGWQLQPKDRTVQGELESAISGIIGEPVRVHGSGRTDSGVHALGQVCHFDLTDRYASIPWQRALNSLLADDISILCCELVSHEFHSRYSALSKTYAYTLWHRQDFMHPQRRNYAWKCGELDFPAMGQAADILLGTHDFASFQNVGTPVKSTVRTLSSVVWEQGENEFETVWRFSADGFLKQMVRNIMGCLVAAGRGKVSPEHVRSILDEADRTVAPGTAPACGLCLEHVEYPEGMVQERCIERSENNPVLADSGER